jgi:hypothetical protein
MALDFNIVKRASSAKPTSQSGTTVALKKVNAALPLSLNDNSKYLKL